MDGNSNSIQRKIRTWSQLAHAEDSFYQGEYNFYGDRDGKGIEIMPNKMILGWWNHGKLHGDIVTITADGTVKKLKYNMGEKE